MTPRTQNARLSAHGHGRERCSSRSSEFPEVLDQQRRSAGRPLPAHIRWRERCSSRFAELCQGSHLSCGPTTCTSNLRQTSAARLRVPSRPGPNRQVARQTAAPRQKPKLQFDRNCFFFFRPRFRCSEEYADLQRIENRRTDDTVWANTRTTVFLESLLEDYLPYYAESRWRCVSCCTIMRRTIPGEQPRRSRPPGSSDHQRRRRHPRQFVATGGGAALAMARNSIRWTPRREP